MYRLLKWWGKGVRIAAGVIALLVAVALIATAIGAAFTGVMSGDIGLIAVSLLPASIGFLLLRVARFLLRKPLRIGALRYHNINRKWPI